jgi:hypothetical protein
MAFDPRKKMAGTMNEKGVREMNMNQYDTAHRKYMPLNTEEMAKNWKELIDRLWHKHSCNP